TRVVVVESNLGQELVPERDEPAEIAYVVLQLLLREERPREHVVVTRAAAPVEHGDRLGPVCCSREDVAEREHRIVPAGIVTDDRAAVRDFVRDAQRARAGNGGRELRPPAAVGVLDTGRVPPADGSRPAFGDVLPLGSHPPPTAATTASTSSSVSCG